MSRTKRIPVSRTQSEMSCWAMLATSLLTSETFNSLQRLHHQGKWAISEGSSIGSLITNSSFEWSYWPSILAQRIIEYLITPNIRQYELSNRPAP